MSTGRDNKAVHEGVAMITLMEIVERCSMLEVAERRHQDETYSELVFHNKEIDEWHRILSEVLGPPVKPAGETPTRDMGRLTQEYGGIRADQTLFMREFDEVTVMAMFWPWSDRRHTTLKMTLLEKQKHEVNTSPPKAGLSFAALRTALGKILLKKPSNNKPV